MDNLNRVPYVKTYIDWIDLPYDVLYWDRSGLRESVGEAHAYAYARPVRASADGANKAQKLLGYIGFRRFACRMLRENDYRLVFALTGNCAVLVSDVLLGKYQKRFVIDVRDYWHEDFAPYHEREQRCIRGSALAVISSPAYREFLCDHDYYVMHNDQLLDSGTVARWRSKTERSKPFVVACVGAMKNPDYDKRVIDYFANDGRFELRFVGRGYDQLSEYCSRNQVENVSVRGAFPMSETMSQYEGADAILNMYGNHSPYWDYALSNKLYFAARLGLPILVCADTAMAGYSKRFHFGYEVNLDDPSCKEAVLESYRPDLRARRIEGCDEFLRMVEADNARTRQAVQGLL